MSGPPEHHPGYGEHIARALATAGGHLAIGEGGATLYFENGWLSGCLTDVVKAEAVKAGLPVIDSRPVPFQQRCVLVLHGPMVAIGHEPSPAPWGPLDFAPLEAVGEAYRKAGAEVFNLPASAAKRISPADFARDRRDS